MPKSWRWDIFWCMAVAASLTVITLVMSKPKGDGSDILKFEMRQMDHLTPPRNI